jgi:hypothetical protein
MFKTQLQIHHRAEDVALWPQLRDTVHTRDALAVLDEMQAEHAHIDPAVDAVDAGFAARDESALFRALERLTASLATHTRHEENAALPLVEQHLGPAGWAVFTGHIRRIQGLRGGAEFFPWLLEDAPESSHDRVLQLVPPPVRLIYRLVWKPRYQRRLCALRRSEATA